MAQVYIADTCVVCLDGPPVPCFVPCHHQCCCSSCADEIMAVVMPCPMCRQLIDDATIIDNFVTAPIPDDQLRAFSDRRPEFLVDLRGPKHTKNAAFVGKSAFARSVGAAIGDELELRRKETLGGERCMTPRKHITMRVAPADQLLHVEYKVGRKTYKDAYAFCDWPTLQAEMRDLFVYNPPTMLALATYGPAYFWLVHYHTQGKVEDALNTLFPPVANKRRRVKPSDAVDVMV